MSYDINTWIAWASGIVALAVIAVPMLPILRRYSVRVDGSPQTVRFFTLKGATDHAAMAKHVFTTVSVVDRWDTANTLMIINGHEEGFGTFNTRI